MRKLLLLAVVLAACARAETPAADTTAAVAPTPPPPPALTAADVAGVWNGVSHPEVGDSVVNRWKVESVTDSTARLTIEGQKTAIPFTRKLDADSIVATSEPYTDPTTPKGPKVVFRSVGRLKDGKLVGTSTIMLASKPDSVVNRGRWEATKAAP